MCTDEVLTDHEWDTVFGMVYDSYVKRIIRCLRDYNTLSLREERLVLNLMYLSPDEYDWGDMKRYEGYSRRILADLVTYVSEGAFRLDYLPAPNSGLAGKEEIVTMNGGERSIVFRVGGRMNMPHISDQYMYYLMRLVERSAEIAGGKRAEDMPSFASQMFEERNVLTDDYEKTYERFVRERRHYGREDEVE